MKNAKSPPVSHVGMVGWLVDWFVDGIDEWITNEGGRITDCIDPFVRQPQISLDCGSDAA